jgi:hypothetical protein
MARSKTKAASQAKSAGKKSKLRGNSANTDKTLAVIVRRLDALARGLKNGLKNGKQDLTKGLKNVRQDLTKRLKNVRQDLTKRLNKVQSKLTKDMKLQLEKALENVATKKDVQNATAVRNKVVHLEGVPLVRYDLLPSNSRNPGTLSWTPTAGRRFTIPFANTTTFAIPWQEAKRRSVWLRFSGSSVTWQCNGVLLDHETVLTTAHSLDDFWKCKSCRLDKVKLAGRPAVKAHLQEILVNPDYVSSFKKELLEKKKSAAGLDVALLRLAHPLPSRSTLAYPQVARPTLGGGPMTAFTVYKAEGNQKIDEYTTRLDCNRVSRSHSWYQGPGRQGHSGSGVYDSDGRLVGLMSESIEASVEKRPKK